MSDEQVESSVVETATQEAVTPEAPAQAEAPKSAAVVKPIPADIQKKQDSEKAAKEAAKPKAVAAKSIVDKAGEKAEVAPISKEVPEKYEFKAPEGSTLDEAILSEFEPLAKEAKLTNEEAQKFVDLYAGKMKSMAEANAAAAEKVISDWGEEAKKALGANASQELAFVAKARDQFFSPESRELINQFGLGNNINFIRDMIKIGKQISEDKLVEGSQRVDSQASVAKSMYPTMKE